MTELFNRIDIIIGGIIAITGGLIGTAGSLIAVRYQVKKACQIRFDQLLAEKLINIGQEAYGKLSYIEAMFLQSSPKRTSNQMFKYNEWFFNNYLYLPDEFSEKWRAIRRDLLKLKQLDSRDTRDSDKIGELEDSVKNTIDEAKDILGKEFKRKKLKIKAN